MASSLSVIFSENAKEKFARIHKPAEVQRSSITKKAKSTAIGQNEGADNSVPAMTEKSIEKKRKRKENRENKDKAKKLATTVLAENGDVGTDGNAQYNSDNTIFVGNIPVNETAKSIKKLFSKYGEIESIRLRSVPIAGTKVDDAGNQDLVRKVCVNSKKFGEQKGSFNAYITFKTADSAASSLNENNSLMGKRHLRVDRQQPSLFDPKCSVFLGNLPHYADEEDIRDFFAKVVPKGHDDIVGLRIIRDPATLVGKGIGYMLFTDRDAVMKALTLHQAVYKKRWALRVSACGKRTKRSEQNQQQQQQQQQPQDSNAQEEVNEETAKEPARKRSKKEHSSPKRSSNGDNAMKRIKLKSVVTKSKILRERKQNKDKRGKKLGGVIKRAIKASKAKK